MSRPAPTVVVCRLLPPIITETEFTDSVPAEFISAIEHIDFVPGRRLDRPSPETPNQNARCYLRFRSSQIASEFMSKFHGHQFIDDQGVSFRVVAAFAPNQRFPRRGKPLCNLFEDKIDFDDHFIKFTEGVTIPLPKPEYTLDKGKVTPLIQALIDQDKRKKRSVERPKSAKSDQSSGSMRKREKPGKPPAPPPVPPPRDSAEPGVRREVKIKAKPKILARKD